MLKIVMCLEQCVPSEELNEDATNAPDVTGVAPAKVQDDFRRSIVSSGNNRGMVLVIERGRSEIDQSDFGVKQHPSLPSNTLSSGRR